VNILKETELVKKVQERLREVLSEVKGIDLPQNEWLGRGKGPPADSGYDLKMRAEEAGGRTRWLCIEVKSQGHPKIAQNAVLQLNHAADKRDDSLRCYDIFAAPYISPDAARICREAGVGYLDLSGNCHLSFGGVYIHIEGRPNQYKPKRAHGSLFSPKASRVLRPLLYRPLRPWKVAELKEEAGVSMGTVSTVRGELLKQVWAEETKQGLRVTKPDALLDAWSRKDDWKRRTTVREYSLLIKDPDEIAHKIHRICETQPHAFTQWYAAFLRRPHTVTDVVSLYVSAFPEEHFIKGDLLGRRVDSGGSLRLVVPQDDGVFLGKQHSNGLPLVSDLQIYLDLIDAGMRGDEAAEELRNWEQFYKDPNV